MGVGLRRQPPLGRHRRRAAARPRRGSTRKGALVGVDRAVGRAARRSTTPRSRSARSGFSALVAWNALELADGHRRRRACAGDAGELAEAIDARWDAELATWVDDGPTAAGSGRIRTLDALLPALAAPAARGVRARSLDPAAFGAPCGPRGVHAAEPTYEPAAYWRGPAWPQLTYLLWLAATSSGSDGGRLGAR